MSIVLIGCGRMGSALLKGWLAQDVTAITVVEPRPSAATRKLAKAKKITLVAAPSDVLARPAVCVVAIKPQVLKGEAATLAGFAQPRAKNKGALMLSIAAGTSVAAMKKAWGPAARIIRAMPNTPGAIGAGITGLYAARGVTAGDRTRAVSLLSGLGATQWLKRESLIDSVTAISGSGPAYLFLFAEALTQAGIAEGLTPRQAEIFARATVSGAGALLSADMTSASKLREAVTSPGGTTAAALAVFLDDDALMTLVGRAARAARMRAQELG